MDFWKSISDVYDKTVEWTCKPYRFVNLKSKILKTEYRYTCPNCNRYIMSHDIYDIFILPSRGHKYCGYCGYKCIKDKKENNII